MKIKLSLIACFFVAATIGHAALVAYFPVDSGTDSSRFLNDIIDDGTHGITDGSGISNAGRIIFDATRNGDVLRTVQTHRYNAGIQDINLTSGFTWSLWINSDSAANAADVTADVIIGSRDGSWHKVQPNGTQRWLNHSGFNVDDDTWHHIAYTGIFDGTNTVSEFWVDGSVVSTFTGTTQDGLLTNDDPFEIGGTTAFIEDWTGLMDDIAVWDEVLTDAQIQGLADGSLTPLTVPEPSSVLLAALGALTLFRRRR